jgi:predicted nucleic acid-binding protein
LNVLVDTSVWALALRRTRSAPAPEARELAELIAEGRAQMMGLVRQELLSGIKDDRQFAGVRDQLRAFPDLALESADHEHAAKFCNRCRARGVQGSSVDFLICAVSSRRSLAIFTTDHDFARYARLVPVQLHALRA